MARKKKTSKVVWARRFIQAAFLSLFFYLFLQASYHPINEVGGPVTLFFDFNPLLSLTTFLASHTLPAMMLLSLVVVFLTLVFGRWFCGWVCPFGTCHNFFTGLRSARTKEKMLRGEYHAGQRWKYYFLLVVLGAALIGTNVAGWLDPFSFFYRSLATAVYPALSSGVHLLFGWIYEVDPGIGSARLTAASEPVYSFLKEHFLDVEQPQYKWGVLIGLLFGGVVALNFYRARFWCRVLCPLGALLGVFGRNPVLEIRRNPETCNECGLCVANCQGGANPNQTPGWKPSECFFCWNCASDCPSNSITFALQSRARSANDRAD